MSHSILNTTKELLLVSIEETAFDTILMTHINTVFTTLSQIGVGPEPVFFITSKDDTWDDFLGGDLRTLAAVRSYIYMKVRLMFDPPTVSFLLTAMENQIKELESRMAVEVTPEVLTPDEEVL